MLQELKNTIITCLINKTKATVDSEKEDYVHRMICEEMYYGYKEDGYIEGIVLYIYRSILTQCKLNKLPLTDQVIDGFMTPDFCINRAYEYLRFRLESPLVEEARMTR